MTEIQFCLSIHIDSCDCLLYQFTCSVCLSTYFGKNSVSWGLGGRSSVLKRQGSVSDSPANNCLVHFYKRFRGIQILAIQGSS